MDRESPDVIAQEMQETRNSLTEKVAALETQVVGTIQNATEAVSSTVEQVKTVVQDTLSSVKDTASDVRQSVTDSVQTVTDRVESAFELSRHTREHPWPMVGGAGVAGFLAGYLLFGRSSPRQAVSPYPTMYTSAAAPMAARSPEPVAPVPRKMPGWLDDLLERAGQEVRKIGEEALAVATASLKQSVQTEVPKLINSFTSVGEEPSTAGSSPEHRRTGNGFGRTC
jgi:ElaB/YqjD/DUF883 family membrane-anchored ribosome-binding protein